MLSKGDVNKEEVLNLALNGIEINEPKDIIKDPYVFEFLGVPENKPMLESDLEKDSYDNTWEEAVNEWEITDKYLYPIGSSCITKFE